jgi:hypothetical protein
LSQSTKPLTVEIRPDQAVLERLLLNKPNYLAGQPVTAKVSDFVAREAGNGHENNPSAVATLVRTEIPYNPAEGWFPEPQTIASNPVLNENQIAIAKPESQPDIQDPKALAPAKHASEDSSPAYVYKLSEAQPEELAKSNIEAQGIGEYTYRVDQKASQQNNSLFPVSEPSATAEPSFKVPVEQAIAPVGQSISTIQEPAEQAISTPQLPNQPANQFDFFATAPPLIAPPQSKKEEPQAFDTSPNPPASPINSSSASVSEQMEPVKVAAPMGYQKTEESEPISEPAQQQANQDSATADDDDQLDQNAFDYEAPARRSFSGKPSGESVKKPSAKTAEKANDDDDDSDIPAKKSSAKGEIELFGITLSHKKAVLIACLVCLVLFIAIQSVCSIAGTFLGAVNQKLSTPKASLSGIWRFAMQANKAQARGVMYVHQRGNQIYGSGRDTAKGPFKFSGSLKGGGEIEFLKQYSQAGQDIGKPITFRGDLDTTSNPIFAKGDFQSTFRRGYSWRAEIVNITGVWEAELIKPMEEDQSYTGGPPPPPPPPKRPESFLEWAIHNGVLIAGVLIALVVFCWQGAIWLFGPDGWRAQRDKAKYIPSQVRRDHSKELKMLAQPVQPGSLPLGRRREWQFWTFWEKKDLALPPDVRTANPHVLFLGGGGKGKSRLMAQMIAHDIESNDRAVVVIDSDGSTSDLIVNWMAAHERGKEFAKRAMIIDPTCLAGSLSYNPLEMPEDGDLPNAAAAIEYGFKAIYTEPPGSQSQWTPQTAQILRSAALLLMITGRTLADLPNLLQDNDFRDARLEEAERKSKDKPEYRPLLDSWGNYKKMARTEQWINWVEPILNRVQRTLSDPRVRPIITNPTSDVSLKDLIINKKVLIVHIPKGELHENANLVGSLVVTGLKQAALAVAIRGKGENRPVALYVDEFDHFIEKETFNALTSETKVFQIGFLGATKTLQDFPEDFRNNLVAKFGTMAIFALPKKDGDMLGPQMFRVDGRKRKHETLTNFFNPINTSPQFEFVSDEEKLNIDKILGQPERVFFCYRVGSVAGLFHLKSHTFNDIPEKDLNHKLIERMRKGGSSNGNGSGNPAAAKVSKDSVKV